MREFFKYHGAGNDFILIDDRKKVFDPKNTEVIKSLCHRHFGVGADGIMLLRNHAEYDFEMIYMNSDGSRGAMCGNGARCIMHFAHHVLKIIKDPAHIKFLAADGPHEGAVRGDMVKVKMQDVKEVTTRNELPFLYSGTTPHNIVLVKDLKNYPVVLEGRRIRNSDPGGVNVNFVEIKGSVCNVRTYERGVEDETMACGTGATSVAIALYNQKILKENLVQIKMPGGDLMVEFTKKPDGSYTDVWLLGPAKYVFKGLL